MAQVHHVDPEGRDAGVVYSEMQARENTSSDLANLELQRLANPEGSAYRSETGGLMEALRVLTVEDSESRPASWHSISCSSIDSPEVSQ
jgi:Zn-dependent M16 (insulinase) family peptidase